MTSELKPCPFCLVVPSASANASRYDPKGAATRNGRLYQPQLGYMCVPCGVHRLVDVPFDVQFGERAYEIARLHWNTRAAPHVPELVRYRMEGYEDTFYEDGHTQVDGFSVNEIEDKEGEYVRHDQAVAVIASLEKKFSFSEKLAKQRLERAEAAETKLAQIEKQEAGGVHVDISGILRD